MKEITVIGIDPAPSRDSTIFDGKYFDQKCYKKLHEYINDLKQSKSKILICWDAPLSFGIGNCTDEKASPLYQRKIEYFFSRKNGKKTPTGISVRGYAGCPHWTISQYILGYPKIGAFDQKFNPPFNLIFDKNKITKSVTEVHPAVAIWFWCINKKAKLNNWNYKKDSSTFKKILEILVSKEIISQEVKKKIENDDQLDAYIAWKLGDEWIKNNRNVEILGDNNTGSFLLPFNEEVSKNFLDFKI